MSGGKLDFVLCWHMHQPWYRAGADYRLPWVYLHATKDYVDMAAHLEAHPNVAAVVNFTPVLLEQLDDYARDIARWQQSGAPMSEPLLNLLVGAQPIPESVAARAELVRACARGHAPTMIDVLPRYRSLLDISYRDERPLQSVLGYLNEQYFLDLLSWYHLAWLGQSLRERPEVAALIGRGGEFDAACRRQLLALVRDVIAGIVPRFRALAERGRVELSTSPWGHPIVPLLIDFDAMSANQPGDPAPAAAVYPGGLDRARWHIGRGIEVFEKHFGARPAGMWLSEGALSDAAVALLDEFGLRWTASGEGVWANSHRRAAADTATRRESLFRCHRVDGIDARVFFRDDGLSDLIGFEYRGWDAAAAAADFIGHLRNISAFLAGKEGRHVVSVILDGENAWEYFPDNGWNFLDALYTELEHADDIRSLTFAEASAECEPLVLPSLSPGSWVYGTLSTWIGHPDKNRAWDLLVAAKQAVDGYLEDAAVDAGRRAAVERQLGICESSDWFWWFGDSNPASSVRDFERLYREQLGELYRLIEQPPPALLEVPLSRGGGDAELGGAMRRGHAEVLES